ncbi:cytochrome P450 4A4-like [Pomacea canaliculata]|uniref:cytochrome P450 4A4-like n=1 Tax=Pomacea canaliculata TaxID=400727 RepID=UPI000D728762|nr:cytochrome P450 4A4-like [Pomacea canaliculata]
MEERGTDWFMWLVSCAVRELTWFNIFVYGSILLLSWLICKLFILPQLSPLRQIPGRPRGSLFFGCFSEIMRKEAIDPYAEWMNEMKTGIIRYYHIMGSQRVLIVDADAVKHVLVTNASNYPRPFFHFKFFTEIVGTSLLTLEGQEHHVQRRLCNSAFKLPELHRLLPTFQRHFDHLCKKWNEQVKMGKEGPVQVDVTSHLANAAFDVITESGFGYDCNSLDDPENFFSKAFTYVLGGGKKSIDRHVRILLPKLYRYIPNEDNKMFRKSLKCLHDLIQTIISRKRKSLESKQSAGEDHKPDLLEILLSASDVETGFGFSEKQLRDHSMTFLIAGHETSATGLSWILLCLSQHPHIQHKARQEVLSVLPPRGQPITPQHLDQLAYVTCVVKETLRLYPPVPTIMREAKNDDILCGFPIPKGTIINISIGALHRNPVYWDNPEDFRPERFMNESAIPPYAYLPFISGPHMCIGHRFALLEMKLALAMLLRQFEFSPLPDVVYKKKQFITMRPYPALKLNVRCLS